MNTANGDAGGIHHVCNSASMLCGAESSETALPLGKMKYRYVPSCNS